MAKGKSGQSSSRNNEGRFSGENDDYRSSRPMQSRSDRNAGGAYGEDQDEYGSGSQSRQSQSRGGQYQSQGGQSGGEWHEPSQWYADDQQSRQQQRSSQGQGWDGGLDSQQSSRSRNQGDYDSESGSETTGRNYASGGNRQNYRDEDQNRSRYR